MASWYKTTQSQQRDYENRDKLFTLQAFNMQQQDDDKRTNKNDEII